MRQRSEEQVLPYSYLVDNIKVLLIFLVVFNHIIAFQLVKIDIVIRYIWYAITIFHMPAFIFVSGYLSKRPQSVVKNIKNLLIPYVLGYALTWYAYTWLGNRMAFQILRPSGTVMWYVLALLVYRLTIEAVGKVRFILPLSIIFALWAGTSPEFTTYLSTSRVVVFFPFFVAGYLWKSEHVQAIRKFKGKWILIPIAGFMLYAVPNYMISNEMPVDIFRGNHSYLLSGFTVEDGVVIRLLMYIVSFVLILTFFALFPDRKLPTTFIGRNTMGIYFFHYPILIVANGLLLLSIPEMLNVWALLGVSLVMVLVLGSPPVHWLYTGVLNLLSFLIFKKEKVEDEEERDEALEDEYDEDEDRHAVLQKRREAIEELAASLEEEKRREAAEEEKRRKAIEELSASQEKEERRKAAGEEENRQTIEELPDISEEEYQEPAGEEENRQTIGELPDISEEEYQEPAEEEKRWKVFEELSAGLGEEYQELPSDGTGKEAEEQE